MISNFKCAVNPHIINKIEDKNSPLWNIAATGFENVELSPKELADHINDGVAFCAQHNGRRNERNFTGTNLLAVDLDQGWRQEDVLADAYVKENASIVYQTPSHTEEQHRLRIVFQLPRLIVDWREMRAAYNGVITKFGGDPACRDACRLFFGSKGSNPVVIGNVTSDAALVELITLGEAKRVSDSNGDKQGSASKPATHRSEIALAVNQTVELSSGQQILLSEAITRTPIKCPIHNDRNPSALVVTNRNGVNGVHCKSCNASYWPQSVRGHQPEPFDFFFSEKVVSDLQRWDDPSYQNDEERRIEDGEDAVNVSRHIVFSKRYVTDQSIPFAEGITFLRSPKGTGKTKWLENVVTLCRNEGKSVLLIGHRQTLLRTLADRLSLTCYFRFDVQRQRNNKPTDYYAICLDSMGKLLKPSDHRYDVVIVDEAEQVISHLTGGTLKAKRRKCFESFLFYLGNARSVIASDADLGQITVTTVCAMACKGMDYRFYVNMYKESFCPFYVYDDDLHLTQAMINAVSKGGRFYVATNSKTRAEQMAEMLAMKFGNKRNVMLVTSETIKKQEVSDFVQDIEKAIFKFDVTIASPTLGTGIDITFENGESHVDAVFGFFGARINTHFDMDQQLCRVRKPKEIRVWVTPERFAFETEVSAISEEVRDSDELNELFNGYAKNGMPEVDERYLEMYANIRSISRASKNRLRENFIELRQHNGWKVIPIAIDSDIREQAKEIVQSARDAVRLRKIDAICNAIEISHEDYAHFQENSSMGIGLTAEKELAMRRKELETFYREKITPELADLDDGGSYRQKVRLMHVYLAPLNQIREGADVDRAQNRFASDSNRDASKQYLLHKLLHAAGIADKHGELLLDAAVTQESLGPFAKLCRERSGLLETLFDISVRRDGEKKAKSQLDVVVDLIGLKFGKAERKKIKGQSVYIYRLDPDSWFKIKRIIDRRLTIDVSHVSKMTFRVTTA